VSQETDRPPQPEGATDRESRLAQALAEFVDMQARDEPVDIEGFCRRHAHLEPELRALLETLAELEPPTQDAEPASPPAPREALPERLSGHRILGEIGHGGMGAVLLAEDERLGRRVAIKVLGKRFRDRAALRTRFMQEARALAQVSHPNIVHIYHLGQPDEMPHFVMELVEGAPLTQAARPLPLAQRIELFRKVVLAVDCLHQHQIIHRDIKPGNVLAGPELEPKLLDFGLALQVGDPTRLTQAGEVVGTPNYFSPEQARAEDALDARSDIFSLGVLLYELLTGTVPFRGQSFVELRERICYHDPVLPRRLDPSIPGELQNICLKALEKDPGQRYQTARELAHDLERYLAHEPVLALPSQYGRLTEGKIEQHKRELQRWLEDRVISEYEYDALRKGYDRLIEREDAWILQVRRLYPSQVALYLGAWVLVVGAALVFLFHYDDLPGTAGVLLVGAAAAAAAAIGLRLWRQGVLRIAVAYLLAFCLILPIGLLVGMQEFGWLDQPETFDWTDPETGKTFPVVSDKELYAKLDVDTEVFKFTTNMQLWWALFLSLPAYVGLRRFTRSSVFSLVLAVMATLLCVVTLMRLGMFEWLEEDPGQFYLRLLPFALGFFLIAIVLERRRQEDDSRYFYPVAILFTFAALSGLAAQHEPYRQWLERVVPWTRGHIEYLFMLNAGCYFLLHGACESLRTPQMRAVAKVFRFVIPGHVLTALLLLGMEASARWSEDLDNPALHMEARAFEFLLPAAASLFVFASIPKQMKNYVVSGLVFLAIGIVRLQQNYFKDHELWPVTLMVAGLLLMLVAVNYPTLRRALSRWPGSVH